MAAIRLIIGLLILGFSVQVMAAPAVYDSTTGQLDVSVLRISGATTELDPAYQATFYEIGGHGSFIFGCPEIFGPTVQPLSAGDAVYDFVSSELTLPEVVLAGTATPRYRVVLAVNLSNCIVSIVEARVMGNSCDKRFSAVEGFTGTCTEYTGSLWENSIPTLEGLCNQSIQAPTTWSTSSCPQEGLVGYCQMDPGSTTDTLVHYYENYPPSLLGSSTVADVAQLTCETQPTAVWVLVN